MENSTDEKIIRILQIGCTANCGGMENFVMNTYRNIDRNKIQFDFLTTHNGKIAYEDEIKSLGGKIYRVTYRKKENMIKHYTELYKFFKNHPEIDGIHMNSCFWNYILPLKMAKKFGMKIRIFHSHNSANMFGDTFLYKILGKYNKSKIKKLATHLLACSNEAGRYMFDDNFEVIENGIDTNKYKFDRNIRKKKQDELQINGKKVIGFAGRLQEQKNPMFALKVFNELYKIRKDVIFLIIGDGDLKEEMLEYVRRNNLEKAVIFLGMRKDMSDLYNVMDVFFLPSRFEGLGIVFVEAQANGLHCVTSTGIPDEACVTDLVKRIELQEPIEIWINDLLNNLNEKRDEKYNSIVRSKYEISITVKKLEEIYLK